MAITATPLPGKYPLPQTITLSSDTVGLDKIRYTLDGSDPRTYLSPIYSAPIVLISPVTIKAVEIVEDDTASAIYEFLFDIYDQSVDSDQDGIPDGVEGTADLDNDGLSDNLDTDTDSDSIPDAVEAGPDPLHPVDTDGDSTPDYKDLDSDNDGIADSIERTDDFDNDSVPNYIDPDQVPQLIVTFHNLPNPLNLVENVPHTFSVEIRNGSGTMLIVNPSKFLVGLPSVSAPIPVSIGETYTYTVMGSDCRSADTGNFSFVFKDAFNNAETSFTFNFNIADSSDALPIQGVVVTWTKNWLASKYRIYRKNPSDIDFSLLIEIPHDPQRSKNTQFYIDRAGTSSSKYSVCAVDSNGVEGEWSLPKHAPDISTSACLIQGNISDVGLSPISGALVGFRTKEIPKIINNTVLLRSSNLVETDIRGYFEARVPQGSLITLYVDDAGYKKDLIIPNVTSIDLAELLAMPQNAG